ncbi:MAG: hypothetical protein IPP90_11055 [Gemmatimonadaceae bacterium]|nr:hypothetical protein [Gemmatimonadaceae bacterium]
MRKVVGLLAFVVVAWMVLRSPTTAVNPSGATPAAGASGQALSPQTQPTEQHSTVGFRSPARLEEHFRKHGAEFGQVSIDQYLARAQALRDAPVGGNVLEVVRPSDGVVSRFDRESGAFLAADADGTIRTFFKPNDGEAYFRRQVKRRPSP